MPKDRITDWAMFLAIKYLVLAGVDTQEVIAEKLDLYVNRRGEKHPNHMFIQTQINLSRLPIFVQAEYEKLCYIGPKSTPVRWAHVLRLYKAFNSEFSTHPEGDGPLFQTYWRDITQKQD